MRTADVVVIGAGVIGASVAWHLARRGVREVLIVERGQTVGEGSTARATGGFRAQFGSEINVRLSLLARAKLLLFVDEVGADPGYRPVGYLFVARTREALEGLGEAIAVQRRAGLEESRLVDAEEALRRAPGIAPDGVLGGAFGPRDGFIVPTAIQAGYLAGARVELGTNVVGLELAAGRVTAVRTTRGPIAAGVVVNAAGAWAAGFGVDVPVVPRWRSILPAAGPGRLAHDHPMTIFVDDGFHFRVRDGRALLLLPGDGDDAWVADVERLTRARVPALDGVSVDRAAMWSGLYEMSPDGHALLGRAPGVENLILVNGSSGHGVMHSPALGQLAAEIIVDGEARSLDVRALRPERFAEGDPVAGLALL